MNFWLGAGIAKQPESSDTTPAATRAREVFMVAREDKKDCDGTQAHAHGMDICTRRIKTTTAIGVRKRQLREEDIESKVAVVQEQRRNTEQRFE
jgi:hypothetical protein